MNRAAVAPAGGPAQTARITRHAGFDRGVHWLAAACVLILLLTAFLPILGVEFAWVTPHWSAGFVLAAIVAIHIVRTAFRRNPGSIWIGGADLGDALAIVRATLRPGTRAPKPGKYSVAQKTIHLAFAVVVLASIATGGLMMVKIDTPWWDRNPYWLTDAQWGIVYVVHGLAALLLVTMVMTHVYFAVRPEKRYFLRAMILGWITQREFDAGHDPQRWQVDKK